MDKQSAIYMYLGGMSGRTGSNYQKSKYTYSGCRFLLYEGFCVRVSMCGFLCADTYVPVVMCGFLCASTYVPVSLYSKFFITPFYPISLYSNTSKTNSVGSNSILNHPQKHQISSWFPLQQILKPFNSFSIQSVLEQFNSIQFHYILLPSLATRERMTKHSN